MHNHAYKGQKTHKKKTEHADSSQAMLLSVASAVATPVKY